MDTFLAQHLCALPPVPRGHIRKGMLCPKLTPLFPFYQLHAASHHSALLLSHHSEKILYYLQSLREKKSYSVTAATFGQTSITSCQLLGFLYHFFSFSSNIHNVISTPSTRSREYSTWLRKFSNCTHTASQNTQWLSKLSFKISM